MVSVLEDIRYLENVNLVSGFCCMLLQKYEEAKAFLLKGSYTKDALDICRDMLQWEQALLLAHKYEPDQVPFIAREYAQQLEFKYDQAFDISPPSILQANLLVFSPPIYQWQLHRCSVQL